MGLRCLLGHDYSEPEIEREREEQGNEVVVTVREFKECGRCGERTIISENKEVTAIEEPEPNPSPSDTGSVETETPGSETVGTGATGTETAGTGTAGEATTDAEPESAVGSSALDDDFEPPQSAEEDDGIILEEDDFEDEEEAGRRHGEWPDRDDHGVDAREHSQGEWPDAEEADEGFSAQPDDGAAADVEYGGGLTPEDAPNVEDAEYVEATPRENTQSTTEETGFTRSRAVTPPDQASEANPNADLVCPECGHVSQSVGSSLRAGDICPECRKGYLDERA